VEHSPKLSHTIQEEEKEKEKEGRLYAEKTKRARKKNTRTNENVWNSKHHLLYIRYCIA
jgi:hypothetical protein